MKVRIKGDIAHNHACGCSKCWKPDGAVFSVVAVAPTDNVEVLENGDKLAVVDSAALIQRNACKESGVHMYGPVDRDHPFKGLAFVHPGAFSRNGLDEAGLCGLCFLDHRERLRPSKDVWRTGAPARTRP
ncbi:S-(hydroxymethyl)glutathione synthase [Rhizobium tibeticum]|uniref:Glutathione-dependent formaldehyde-activating enzyme n=1 Tax=Rhizobium tibeticum TaxID=501024 RepID=A0A1H8WPN8_9HYPH|nr:Glutathione-dependent formaldehyde-activating enzyme [Rhizobium tibeticum]SEP29407.1 S-(hydroxymethyl)glutathione synthase [Rhizobium tibeticum]